VRTLPLTWPEGLPFWVVYAWAVLSEFPHLRRARRTTSAADKGSMRGVWIAGVVGVTLALAAAWFVPSAAMQTGALIAYVGGIGSLLTGTLLRRHCFRMLGASFTFDVRVVAHQRVIERGAYRLLRHPSYTGGLLMQGGIGLSLGNWASLVIALVPLSLAYAYRISIEERALVQTLGEPYTDYMKRTYRLIPFVL
jgi:protein-S-isoprenylcysteine O-methyltransferase Ste14